jgi:uncharacterized protein YdeI (YjbR/CyaY-like superfamily)
VAERFFRSAAQLRAWLERNHAGAPELWIGFYNARSARRGITYQEALDEALCYGWIDGVRKRVDDGRYVQRFTPRRTGSKWSAVNVRHARRLIAEGLMRPAGQAAFDRRTADKAGYSFEERPKRLSAAFAKRFRAENRAWDFFRSQAPSYQRTATFWVMSAKRPETRERRLAILMRHSGRAERIPPLARPAPRGRRPRGRR